MNNPNVQRLIHTKAALDLRVSKSFFEGGGWVAPEEYYFGTFDPKTDWVARRRNELKISFDGDARKTKTTLQLLHEHGVQVLTPPPPPDSSDESAPDSPGSEDVRVADLSPAGSHSCPWRTLPTS